MTEQRKLISEVLREGPGHMDAQEIYERARKKMPSLAMGTVYRNLKIMAEAGEILRIPVEGQPDRYDANPLPHDHMRCRACGNFYDVRLPGLPEWLEEHTGCEIDCYTLLLEGTCPDCNGKK